MSFQNVELPLEVDLLPVKRLSAGNLTCLYEKGNLRYFRWGDEEVVRMIYTAVRDHAWATAPYEIQDEYIVENGDSFSVRYTAVYELNEIRYKAAIEIKGAENSISFSMQGEAQSDFLRNRIGICVHHPVAECAGKKVVITHPDGTEAEHHFPVQISPYQPFKNIRKMQWTSDSDITVTLQFAGDVFETEDQRNWTDDSFKTYSTPLDKAIPVPVKNGDTVQQSVSLNVFAPVEKAFTSKNTKLVSESFRLPFPKIGYERTPGSPRLTAEELLLLREIIFDHYRVVLHLSNGNWLHELEIAAAEAKVLSVPMEVIAFLPVTVDEALNSLSVNLQRFSDQTGSVLLLQEGSPVTPAELLQKALPLLKQKLPQVLIGCGTDSFFAELNRNRPSPGLPFDFVSYSVNPQVHATDTRSLLENLAAQKETVELAKAFAPGKKVFVSPVTFKIRTEEPQDETAPPDTDDRMYTSFGAMWTLLAIRNLAGADRITFYQTTGYRGILNGAGQHSLYQVLKQLKTIRPRWVIADVASPGTLRIENEQGDEMKFRFS